MQFRDPTGDFKQGVQVIEFGAQGKDPDWKYNFMGRQQVDNS